MRNVKIITSLRLHIFLALALLSGIAAAQQDAAAPKLVPALGWDIATQGCFTTCVAVDAQNAVWVGTEGKGLWRYGPREKKWTQYTAKDGLGDDYVYALAVDKLGRVWAGHLNHGVSVWNGEKWKNYGVLDGPLGSRVFAIATCPADGDVWIATDCGLARYSIKNDNWDYFNRASGLPSNQVQCVAFDSQGNIYAGTQCNGITMAKASDSYAKWKTSAGPLQVPNAARGSGLPSACINDITVVTLSNAERILAATPLGIAASDDGGEHFNFQRGADWKDVVNGLYEIPKAPAETPGGIDTGLAGAAKDPLAEDWVTSLRQDRQSGAIWMGFRTMGVQVRDAGTKPPVNIDLQGITSLFIRAICIAPKAPPLIATYDDKNGGLKTLDNAAATLDPGSDAPAPPPPLPSAAKPPTADAIVPLVKQLGVFKNKLVPGTGMFIGDDWSTQGDWVGRYGNSYAMICGLEGPGTYNGEEGFEVSIGVGPHSKNEEITNHETDTKSSDRRFPYTPHTGFRSDVEVDDSSFSRESFTLDWEGPDLWLDVTVPEGLHGVSLYFVNDDPQTDDAETDQGQNKLRDYDLQLLAWAEDKDAVQLSQPMARARVTDFYGGVYKQFVVAGPGRFIMRVGKNRSYVAKLHAIFIDRLAGKAGAHTPVPGFDAKPYAAPVVADLHDAGATLSAAHDLWAALDAAFDRPGVAGLQTPLRVWAYRAAASDKAPDDLLAAWRWQARIWTDGDREAFDKAMKLAYKGWSEKNPGAQDDDQ